MSSLLHSRKFWLVVFAVAQSILFQFVPNFPHDVWIAIDALVGVLIASIAAEDAAEKSGAKLSVTRYDDTKPEEELR